MKIAVLSDIHDNIWNLAKALEGMQAAEAMICCGDLCSPFVVHKLGGGYKNGPIHIVFGNNDADLFRISRVAAQYENVRLHGELFEGELGGKRIAAIHFDNIARPIIQSGAYDMVCYGHNHRYQVERVGSTLGINPGTVMGYDPLGQQDVTATYILYDTESGEAQRCEVG